jgi:hypothetical protein
MGGKLIKIMLQKAGNEAVGKGKKYGRNNGSKSM